jgi:two-component system NtrC family sensor kinase
MARQRPPSRAAVDLNEAIDSALELLGYGLRTAGVEVERKPAAGLPKVWADPDQISQVLTNLIVNAQQALADWSGPRRLTIATRFEADAGMVTITVVDTGPGVPADLKLRIFEPFFTTKPMGMGTGIGLSVSHSIIASHGGTLEVGDTPKGGATFTIRLPLGTSATATAGTKIDIPAPRDAGRVLIVGDEPEVAQTLAEILGNQHYRIDVANSGEEALEKLRREDYSVVLSDIRMPAMDGIELYGKVRALKPELAARLIFVTGDALNGTVLDFLDGTGRPRIEKPFMPAEIRHLVAATIAAARSRVGRQAAELADMPSA